MLESLEKPAYLADLDSGVMYLKAQQYPLAVFLKLSYAECDDTMLRKFDGIGRVIKQRLLQSDGIV